MLLTLLVGNASAAPSIYITTEHPLSSVGSARTPDLANVPERVLSIMRRAGISYSIHSYPWKRAYAAALEHPNGCVFATARTAEREALFKWVGPIDESDSMLMGRAGRDYQIKTLEDARKYQIGTYMGDWRTEFLRSRGFKVDPAQNDVSNLPKLLMGRIDLWAAALPRGVVSGVGYFPETVVPVFKFNTIKLYLACNRALPDSVVARLNGAAEIVLEEAWKAPSLGSAPLRPASTSID